MSETSLEYAATRYFDTQSEMEAHAAEMRKGSRARAEEVTEAILHTIRAARHYLPVNSKQAIVELLAKEFAK